MEVDDEYEEEMVLEDAVTRNPFINQEMSFNFVRRRVTDIKGSSRVNLPRKPRSLEEESAMETLRMELKSLLKIGNS